MLERFQIEGRSADEIAVDMTAAFDKYCGRRRRPSNRSKGFSLEGIKYL